MSNKITIELSEADRALLECISAQLGELNDRLPPRVNITTTDPLQQKLAAVVANATEPKIGEVTKEAAKTPTEATKDETLTETHPTEEKPTEANVANVESEKQATTADIRAVYMRLARTSKKDQARALILSYAPTIPEVPADVCAELLGKLTALEG